MTTINSRWTWPATTLAPFLMLMGMLSSELLVSRAAADDAVASTNPNESPMIPDLAWEPRSDWTNVKTAASPGAVGDGIADDTAAIQAALDKIVDGSTLDFPPGTYRITKTLQPPAGRTMGVTLLGHGRTTTLAWDGDVGRSHVLGSRGDAFRPLRCVVARLQCAGSHL